MATLIFPAFIASSLYVAEKIEYEKMIGVFPDFNLVLGALEDLDQIATYPETWEGYEDYDRELRLFVRGSSEKLLDSEWFNFTVHEDYLKLLLELHETEPLRAEMRIEQARSWLLDYNPKLRRPYDGLTPRGETTNAFITFAVGYALVLPLMSFLFRGGLTFFFFGLALVNERGIRVSRLRCLLRGACGTAMFLGLFGVAYSAIAMVYALYIDGSIKMYLPFAFSYFRDGHQIGTLVEEVTVMLIGLAIAYACALIDTIVARRSVVDRLARTYVIRK